MASRKINAAKVKAFFKKNMYYFIMGICVLAIGAMITVALTAGKTNNDTPLDQGIPDTPVVTDPDEPVVTPDKPGIVEPDPIVFSLPTETGAVIKDYTMTTLVFSSTLNQYRVHNGIDFAGEAGDKIMAAYAGTVQSVTYDALNGYVVTIAHADGLSTSYGSLDNVAVSVSDKVNAGTVLGEMSVTATAEMSDGAHTHFMVYKDGQITDPYAYLTIGDK